MTPSSMQGSQINRQAQETILKRYVPLSNWLRDNLYALGRKLPPKETIERLTGSPEIDPGPSSREASPRC